MPSDRPQKFVDDGSTVTIDLHGCSVDAGLYIIKRSLQEAFRRGRKKVEVIHGTSTSDQSEYARTIKNEFQRMLDAGEYQDWVSGKIQDTSGGRTSLWITLSSKPDARRITESDVIKKHR